MNLKNLCVERWADFLKHWLKSNCDKIYAPPKGRWSEGVVQRRDSIELKWNELKENGDIENKTMVVPLTDMGRAIVNNEDIIEIDFCQHCGIVVIENLGCCRNCQKKCFTHDECEYCQYN